MENKIKMGMSKKQKIIKIKGYCTVRTTSEEVEKYRTIKQTLALYYAEVDKANEAMKAAYKAENRPMSGTLDTPGLFAPKSEAIKRADARYGRAVKVFRKVVQMLGGAKMQSRMHRLELAGLI